MRISDFCKWLSELWSRLTNHKKHEPSGGSPAGLEPEQDAILLEAEKEKQKRKKQEEIRMDNYKKEIELSINKNLETARKTSKESPEMLLSGMDNPTTNQKIKAIQWIMSAIRYRLSCHDYENALEKAALMAKLNSLYEQARVLDPGGVKRYEMIVNRRMRKSNRRRQA